jgi:hypothetical protein
MVNTLLLTKKEQAKMTYLKPRRYTLFLPLSAIELPADYLTLFRLTEMLPKALLLVCLPQIPSMVT